MDIQKNAIKELHDFLTTREIPYALIGGIAVQMWGEPRYTQDVDVTIVLDQNKEDAVLLALVQRFKPRISDAVTFALKNRVLLLKSDFSVNLDISLGLPGYEEEIIARAAYCDLGRGMRGIRICSAEDLIVMKIIAGRPRDIDDVETILIRQKNTLDVDYVKEKLEDFTSLLETSDLCLKFDELSRRC